MINFIYGLIVLSLVCVITHSQTTYEDSVKMAQWISYKGEGYNRFNERTGKILHIASADVFITYYPLNEISLWLNTDFRTSHIYGNTTYVLSRIRFGALTGLITMMTSQEYNGNSYVDVPNEKYQDDWEALILKDSQLNREIWSFVNDHFKD